MQGVFMALRYILGIDLGIGSIGTALFKILPEAKDLNDIHSYEKILDAGVRICPVSEGAANRRIFRSQRNAKKHRKARKKALITLLQKYQLLPLDRSELELGLRSQPYALRAKAMQEPLKNPYELGYCIMNIAKLRGAGFIDEAEENEEEKKKSKTSNRYQLLEQALKSENITLSEYLYKHLKENNCVRQRKDFIAEKVPFSVPRYLVKRDYYALMNKQAVHFGITDEQVKAIYTTIFMDSPKAPYANAPCSLLPESGNRLPKMHRLAELLRIYQQCNNIRYCTENETDINKSLTREMRDALTDKLLNGEGLNKTTIKKAIQQFEKEKIKRINSYAQDDEITAIKPFAHKKAFADIPAFGQLSEEKQDKLIEFIADPLDVTASSSKPVLYDEEKFLQICMEKLKLTGLEGEQKLYAALNLLPKDRTMLGKEASKAILDKLINGLADENGEWKATPTYYDAVKACHFVRAEKEQKEYAFLPYYGEVLPHEILPIHPWHMKRTAKEEQMGRIANPVVHSMLNQLRKVVNEIIALYGKPEMIKLEIARDFGLSKIKRDKLEKQRLDNEKNNRVIDEALLSFGYAPTKNNRLKYRLWKEQGYKDIYSQRKFEVSDFNRYQIDHIIPREAGGTNSACNLVLTNENNVKGNVFAYDFIQEKFAECWEAIKKDMEKMPKNKAWRFTAEAKARYALYGDETDEDYAERRLQDTRYMTKVALRYLACICSDILAIRGGMTAKLRHLWGFDGMEYELMGLNVPKDRIDEKTGQVLIDEENKFIPNPDWKAKPRIDHRHHAIDAMVLCAVTRSLAQKMYKADKEDKKITNALVGNPFEFSPENPTHKHFRELAFDTLKQIKISYKPEHDTNTQLHDETAMRILDYDDKKQCYLETYMRSLDKIDSFNKLEKIAVAEKLGTSPQIQKIRKRCAEIIKAVTAQKFAAEQSLIQEEAENLQEGKKGKIKITEKNIVKRAIHLAHIGSKYPFLEYKTLVNINDKLKCGYKPNNNYCVDFFVYTEGKKRGEIGWECIKSIDAANDKKNFKPNWKKEKAKHIWSICKNDMLELRFNEQQIEEYNVPKGFVTQNGQHEYTMLVKVLKFSPDRLTCVSMYDARMEMRETKKEGTEQKENTEKAENLLQKNPKIYGLWMIEEKRLPFYCELKARKVSLSPFGKVISKHKKLWNGKKV